MRVGVVKETKTREARVGLTPAGAGVLVRDGHDVLVEQGAGAGAGFGDRRYEQAGAKLVSRDEAWAGSELLVKVKEPIAAEYRFLREDLTLFTYLHLAADRPLTEALLAARCR
jgi:alanine dehydrogenase